MNKELIKEKAKKLKFKQFDNMVFYEAQEYFEDCFSCCDCEFCMMNDNNEFVCSGKYYDKVLSNKDLDCNICKGTDIDFSTYCELYDIVLENCIDKEEYHKK